MIVQVALPLPLKELFSYAVPERFAAQVRLGQTVLVPFRNRQLKGIVVEIGPGAPRPANAKSYALKEILAPLSEGDALPESDLKLAQWIAARYGTSWGEALKMMLPPVRKIPRRKAGTALLPDEIDFKSKPASGPGKVLTLTQEQTASLTAVKTCIDQKKFGPFLLFGVTASGKTEVYLRAIEEVLKQNRQAIFLVPEISLCPPFYDLLSQRFGAERIGIWHSEAKGKADLYQKIKNGDVEIIIGARSALFVPLRKLGLIVVDEEHDSSYKQDEKPRYHARDLALKIAELKNAAVILGSATPSLESFEKALSGAYTLLELPGRVTSPAPLHIKLIDQKIHSKKSSPFSAQLVEAVDQALQKRQQAILALNRRGYSTFLFCGDCRKVWKCPNCEVTLVTHREFQENGHGHYLKCHYCFYKKRLPGVCDQCGSSALLMGGQGTQRIVQEISRIFPYARVVRLDRDVAGKKSTRQHAYEAFKGENADILVGTQMVVQGFDFPRVTFVGIVDADTALFHPDFRAAERTFQWVTQASGRAGRSEMGGTVMVQTAMPDHYAIQCGARQDYRQFYEKEIEFRKALFYPPYSRLVLFEISSTKRQDLVADESERLMKILQDALRSDVELGGTGKIQLLGPGTAPRANIRKQLRWQILAKCATEAEVERAVHASEKFVPKSGVRFTLDVDPYDLS